MRPPAAAAAAARVLIAGVDGAAATPAPFGLSMFDAVQSAKHENIPAPAVDAVGNPPSPLPVNQAHFDRMMVTMEERWGADDDCNGGTSGKGTASVVIGPARAASVNTDDSTSCCTIPMARAAHDPRVLSTACPTVTLAEANWYETNQPRKDFVQLGVVAAVSDPRGRILLTRRAAHMRSFPRAWVMPGGGLDEGESLTDCLVREVREETGVDVARETVRPFCLWESCYPTCGRECLAAGTGITAHYLVVFCTAQTTEKNLSKLQEQIQLDEQETDMAVWLSAEDFARSLDYPLGGANHIGFIPAMVPSSFSKGSEQSTTCSSVACNLNLDDLCGIYPRGDDDNCMKGIAQGNLFMLQELLNSQGGASFH